jgi:hypothetical protein
MGTIYSRREESGMAIDPKSDNEMRVIVQVNVEGTDVLAAVEAVGNALEAAGLGNWYCVSVVGGKPRTLSAVPATEAEGETE